MENVHGTCKKLFAWFQWAREMLIPPSGQRRPAASPGAVTGAVYHPGLLGNLGYRRGQDHIRIVKGFSSTVRSLV